MDLQSLLSAMWVDYCSLNPSVSRIHELFGGGVVLNDHIALRTFRHPRLGLERMASVFESLGYRACGEYHFEAKRLYAKHYEHPDLTQPKIFISELLVEEFSAPVQDIIFGVVDQISDEVIRSVDFSYSGRSWDLSYQDYEMLAGVSEYASWVASIGFRPNHFTVFLNPLGMSVEQVVEFLESRGYALNASGGKIKGTPSELLEQCSTMSELVPVEFNEGVFMVPGCYYEFARRYAGADGTLYQGFVAASADKIFESTSRIK
jgi:hypothetical protein